MRIPLLPVVVTLFTIPGVVAGQQTSYGDLSGVVIDGSSGNPLRFAHVTLLPDGTGLFPGEHPQREAVVGARGRMTDPNGRYTFGNVTPGHYRLLVRRIGYRPSAVDLQLDGPDGLQLSIGLSIAPIPLEPIETRARPADLFSDQVRVDRQAIDRAPLERWRQETFVATDVQVVNGAQIKEAVSLGERDVLRALQRLPGVSSADDWHAEPWIRGAPSGHTRVYFDGTPVFSPVHSGGLNGSIDPDALSAAFLYPGVRPPAVAEGAAAVLDLRSRAAGAEGLQGRFSASPSRLGGSISRRWFEGRVGAVVTGSRSWLRTTRDLARSSEGFAPDIPNDFADLVVRGDAQIRDNVALEVSSLWQRDWINGFLDGGPANNRMSWGSNVLRATLRFPVGSGTFSQTLGLSRFSAYVSQIEPRAPLAAFDEYPTQEPTNNYLRYLSARGEWVTSDPETSGLRWRIGYELGHYQTGYTGAPPSPYSVLTYLYTLDVSESVQLRRVWAERWWRPGNHWVIRAGVRGEQYQGSDKTFIEPYVAVRHDVTDRIRVSFTTARHAQYAQPLAPSGLSFGPGLTPAPVWVLAPTVGQVLISDVSTLGGDWWIGKDWLGTLHLYWRETGGIAIPDPVPGSTDDDRFLVGATSDSWGSEASLRKLMGRWTGSIAYTLGFSNYSSENLTFPAPSDRRHVFDVVVSQHIQPTVAAGHVNVTGTFTTASGAPYTRVHPGTYDCADYQPGGFCNAIVPTTVESPNAERTPWTTGANVRIEWTRSFDKWTLGAHAQIQNVMNASRAMTYAVDVESCRRSTVNETYCGAAQDAFYPGMRRHFEFGLRLVF